MFTKQNGVDIVIILIYLGDILISGSSKDIIHEAKKNSSGQF